MDHRSPHTSRQPPSAIWLLPEPARKEALAALVERLARRFGAPPFRPHLTVAAGLRRPLAEVTAATMATADLTPPLTLACRGLGHSQSRFQAFFLRFAEEPALAALRDALARRLGAAPHRPQPHLSLLYRQLPEAARRALVDELVTAVPDGVRFDRLAVVTPQVGADDWEVVEGWRLLAERRLAGEDCGASAAGR
jgi:2'-5' RNA ligase